MRVLKEVEHRRGLPRYEVLLISNDLPTIRIIKSYFDSKMFKFKDVSSCSQALEELESQTPMLILLDRTLPEENRIEILKRIKNDKKLRKVSTKTFTKNEYKLQRQIKREKEHHFYKGDELNQNDKKLNRHEDLIQLQRWLNYRSPTTAGKFAEFKINKYITLKLERGKTFIYVNGKRFLQCIRLVLNIQKTKVQMYDEINSIDEAADLYTKQTFQNRIIPGAHPITSQGHDITAEQEFWGHCSNIQAWAEHDYDTRILKSNVSFPLLRQLTQDGDPLAKKVFKEEIALRIEDGNRSVAQYLINEGYLGYLAPSEIKTIIENTKLIENLLVNRNPFFVFLRFCYTKFPNLLKDIILKLLTLPNGPNILISDILGNSRVYSLDYQILNTIKETLENFLKQIDPHQREDIKKIIIKIEGISEKEYREYKVIILGDPAVGKKALLTKFATTPYDESLKSKIGVVMVKVPVELKKRNIIVKLMLWDIAAQQFSTLHSLYFERADGILLVFDISRVSTFSNVINWFSSALSYCPGGVPRILIGNRVNPEDERKITLPMAERLSEELNTPYFETSTAVGENIALIFHKIAELIYKAKELEAKQLDDSKDLGEIVFKFHEDNLKEAKKSRK